jgi:predicted PurR-regulated permease PerM
LISGSFLVYLAYPIILLMLPLTESIKLAAVVAVWVLSWSAFSAGVFLAGPDGIEWLKQLWSRVTRGSLAKKQNGKEFSDPQNNRFTSVDSLEP